MIIPFPGIAAVALVVWTAAAAARSDSTLIVIEHPESTLIVENESPTSSAAPDPEHAQPDTRRLLAIQGDFGIGISPYWFRYEEIITGDDVRELLDVERIRGEPRSGEHGITPAFHTELVVRGRQAPVGGRLSLVFATGHHTYEGSYQVPIADSSGIPRGIHYQPARLRKRNLFVTFSAAVMTRTTLGRLQVVPAVGIERRLWHRWLDEGFREVYRWTSIPIGLELRLALTPQLTMGPALAFRPMVNGTMELDHQERYADLPGDIEIPVLHLGNRSSFRGSLVMEYRLPGHGHGLRIEPWIDFSRFGRSDVDSVTIELDAARGGQSVALEYFYEPASTTFTAGLNITGLLFLDPRRKE